MALERIQSGSTIRILNNSNLMNFQVPNYEPAKMKQAGLALKMERKLLLKKQKSALEAYEKKRKIWLDLLEVD